MANAKVKTTAETVALPVTTLEVDRLGEVLLTGTVEHTFSFRPGTKGLSQEMKARGCDDAEIAFRKEELKRNLTVTIDLTGLSVKDALEQALNRMVVTVNSGLAYGLTDPDEILARLDLYMDLQEGPWAVTWETLDAFPWTEDRGSRGSGPRVSRAEIERAARKAAFAETFQVLKELGLSEATTGLANSTIENREFFSELELKH